MEPKNHPDFQGHPDQAFGYITYAQCGEDMYLANIFTLLGISQPTYLDVGGHHPWAGSNTAWLYERGSRGVVIEANHELIEPFRRARPEDKILNIGVAAESGRMPFYRIGWDSGRNSFSKKTIDDCLEEFTDSWISDSNDVEVSNLNDIIRDYFAGTLPDFLSIDAEGMDFEILRSANFSKSQPTVICAEIRTGRNQDNPDPISNLLKSRGFGDHVVAARYIRDLYRHVGGFTFDTYSPHPAVAEWIFKKFSRLSKFLQQSIYMASYSRVVHRANYNQRFCLQLRCYSHAQDMAKKHS